MASCFSTGFLFLFNFMHVGVYVCMCVYSHLIGLPTITWKKLKNFSVHKLTKYDRNYSKLPGLKLTRFPGKKK